jgi:hypothetical protein
MSIRIRNGIEASDLASGRPMGVEKEKGWRFASRGPNRST